MCDSRQPTDGAGSGPDDGLTVTQRQREAYWARQHELERIQLRVDADTLERAAALLREPYRPWAPDHATAHDLERNARALRVAAKRLEKEAQR